MSKFKDNVIKAVRNIPKRKVASYGQIATMNRYLPDYNVLTDLEMEDKNISEFL